LTKRKDSDLDALFVDTNILVYAHDAAAGEKHSRAKALVSQIWNDRCGVLSTQVLQEFRTRCWNDNRPVVVRSPAAGPYQTSNLYTQLPYRCGSLQATVQRSHKVFPGAGRETSRCLARRSVESMGFPQFVQTLEGDNDEH
jgi:hypothetical protein